MFQETSDYCTAAQEVANNVVLPESEALIHFVMSYIESDKRKI